MFQKSIPKTLGTYYEGVRPAVDMTIMVGFYQAGKIDIDSFITRPYKLNHVKKASQDIERGQIGKGMIIQF